MTKWVGSTHLGLSHLEFVKNGIGQVGPLKFGRLNILVRLVKRWVDGLTRHILTKKKSQTAVEKRIQRKESSSPTRVDGDGLMALA